MLKFDTRCGIAAILAVLTAAGLSAQTMVITPGDGLVAGSEASITYANPALANQKVTVEVSGGFPVPSTEVVTIQLDANGKGVGKWTVTSEWRSARFNAPGVQEVTIPIQS
jgi:hypothetical protein